MNLPVEDCSGKGKGKIGLLKKSMCGTRDTQQAIGNETGKDTSKIGDTSWGALHNKKKKTSGLTHGDDFVVTGSKGSLLELKK